MGEVMFILTGILNLRKEILKKTVLWKEDILTWLRGLQETDPKEQKPGGLMSHEDKNDQIDERIFGHKGKTRDPC